MISEEEYNMKVRIAENMSQEQKDECARGWKIFQTVFDKCQYVETYYWDHDNNLPEKYRVKHYRCLAGSMTGGCAWAGCPKQKEILALAEKLKEVNNDNSF